jgi:alpha-L-fucosidase
MNAPGILGISALALSFALTIPCRPGTSAWAAEPRGVETPQERAARLAWWREARFGMFIHWGPVSLKGTEISWSRGNSNPQCPNSGPIPVAVYDNLYKQFNPTKFDAAEWAGIAKDAGMKYVVLTAKHCDGFLLWHSKVSDYNMAATPFGRDICAELAGAVRKQGLRLGWYFSPMDWRDADFRTQRNAAFVSRMQGEIRELLSNYGQVDLLWFDYDGREPVYDQAATYALVKKLQPKILLTNRLDLGPGDNDRQVLSPYADYYTPEQAVGGYDDRRPWETCMTLGTQWSWKPNDEIKSLSECLRILLRSVGGDGNLLLDVGPMPNGRIEPRQAARLREIGAWLAKYGQSVYGTRGGPFLPWKFGVSTRKDKTIFMHVLAWPGKTIALPPLRANIVRSSLLGGGQVTVAQTGAGIRITVAPAEQQEIDTVVALELDRPAGELSPVAVPGWGKSLAQGKPAKASNVFAESPGYAADKAFDGNDGTRWATAAGTRQAWLEVDLNKPEKFDTAYLAEAYPCRVQSFELQYLDGAAWKTFFKGTTIGEEWIRRFEPVTARRVRLNVLDATNGPTIWEFQLFKSP